MTANHFVKALILPEDHEYEELTAIVSSMKNAKLMTKANEQVSGERSAQVNAGSLTSFVENLTGQDKSDVMNSTLLAQLSANKMHDRMQAPMDWYKYYINVLENIGWNLPGFAFDTYTSGGSTVNLDKAVLGILAAIATGGEIALVQATMNALQAQSADSAPMNIWNANTSGGNNGNFQIIPVANVNDNVVMMMVGMQFKARTSSGGFLWWTWKSTDIDIKRAANKFELNKDVYKQVRQQIIDKLGDKAKTFVANLPDLD
ncbi:MAG: hypothetical protein P2A85_29580 (plasmid) [Microcoleus anatoxicus]|uniref:hypothetical protein n=1 Tax=Microcoleus anatoxicus TaxID=2705319 RepID=UPI00366D39AB